MIVDCDVCPVRGLECGSCPVAILLDPRMVLDADERRAVDELSAQGLIEAPHLAIVTAPAARSASPRESAGHSSGPGLRAVG